MRRPPRPRDTPAKIRDPRASQRAPARTPRSSPRSHRRSDGCRPRAAAPREAPAARPAERPRHHRSPGRLLMTAHSSRDRRRHSRTRARPDRRADDAHARGCRARPPRSAAREAPRRPRARAARAAPGRAPASRYARRSSPPPRRSGTLPVARIAQVGEHRVDRGAHDALERGLARAPPAPQQERDRLDLGQLRRHAEPAVLPIRTLDEPRHDRVDQIDRRRPRRRRALRRPAPRAPVRHRPIQEPVQLGHRQKRGPADKLTASTEQRDAGQPAQVIAGIHVGPRIGIDLHRHGDPLHQGGDTGIIPGVLVHPMTRVTPSRGQHQKSRLRLAPRPLEGSFPHASQRIATPAPDYGACRRNRARAMRRVQLRGGARRQPARRTFRTLSRLPRAPTKQMGPYHRSASGRSRGGGARARE